MVAFVLITAGFLMLAGSLFDWEWHGTVGQLLYTFFGRDGTRVFIGMVGFLMLVGGLIVAMRVVE